MGNNREYKEANRLFLDGQYEAALKRYLSLAEEGSVSSQRFVGWMYYLGEGTEKNFELAQTWFGRAAEAGDSEAEFGIGRIHLVRQEYDLAIKWFSVAAKHGFTPASYRLGWMHYYGKGMPVEHIKALGLWRGASKKGHLKARVGYARALVKGDLGCRKRVAGVFLYIYAIISIIFFAFFDRHSPRFMD